MNRFFERSFPPGFNYLSELKAVAFAFCASILFSLISFFTEYSAEKRALYIQIGTDMILDESRVMPDFINVLGGSLRILFILAALAFIITSTIHYVYYHTGSKSIYLMRRLPNRYEQHRRHLLFSLIYALIFVLAAAILLLIYYSVYINNTPEACLTPNQWQKIWQDS